ncbi:iron chelate uptake ABC transporter family permease subunit [Vibrio lentus]|nr:iron chelate uptake ABC transporter family permease subunit [Vibrio lentus]
MRFWPVVSILLLVTNPIEINTAMVWLTGSLWGETGSKFPFIWNVLLLLLPMALWLAWRIDVMGLGEESATTLGTKPKQIQVLCVIIGRCVLLASVSVFCCWKRSVLGFIASHLARLLFGHNHKLLIPASALVGAILVTSADGLARGLQPPIELPAGVSHVCDWRTIFHLSSHRYRGW